MIMNIYYYENSSTNCISKKYHFQEPLTFHHDHTLIFRWREKIPFNEGGHITPSSGDFGSSERFYHIF